MRAAGNTDINRALLEALAMADKERPTILIFLTDGQPTTGVMDGAQIVANVKQASRGNVRLFAFGIGDDVNAVLLDTLSQDNRGVTAYVRQGQRIDEEVSAFYAKVSTPVLADLKTGLGRDERLGCLPRAAARPVRRLAARAGGTLRFAQQRPGARSS